MTETLTTDWHRFPGNGPFFKLTDGVLQVAQARRMDDTHVWYPDLVTAVAVPEGMSPEATETITRALVGRWEFDRREDGALEAIREFDIEREMRS